uniref:Uncharacterized protein n=1 Tax=Peronospora matthiolae TaxID=2874970 RepID=A0AAV1UFH2_9STRA
MVQAPAVVEVSLARKRSEDTDDKILTTLVGLAERLTKLESSQRVRDEDELILGAVENCIFTSALGAKCAIDQ